MTVWIVSSSLLILLVAALRRLLRGHIALRVQYALWLLVLLRLLIPGFLGQSPVSVANALPAAIRLDAMLPEPVQTALDTPATETSLAVAVTTAAPAAPAEASPARRAALPIAAIARALWLSGAALLLLIVIAGHGRFLLRLRRSRVPVPGADAALPVYTVSWLATPCLAGLFRPAIYLSEDLDPDERRHVLAHEQTHWRHGDLLWSWLRLAALALHWYNPLVWCAAALSKQDAELACDEATLRVLGETERRAYGETLLRLSRPRFGFTLDPSTAMTGGKRGLAERIRCIARRPRMALPTLALVLVLSLSAALFTFTGASAAEDGPPSIGSGTTIVSDDGTVTAVLNAALRSDPFPDGAPVVPLGYHAITPEETARIVAALFGEDAAVYADLPENLSREDPLATQETMRQWLAYARQLQADAVPARLSENDEAWRPRLEERLEAFLTAYDHTPAFDALPHESDLVPMVWTGETQRALVEQDGVLYCVKLTNKTDAGPERWSLSVFPLIDASYPLYLFARYTEFSSPTPASREQIDRAAEKALELAAQMGREDLFVRSAAFDETRPSLDLPSQCFIRVVLDRRYDERLPLTETPHSSLLNPWDELSFLFTNDGRLFRLEIDTPLEALSGGTEAASLPDADAALALVADRIRASTAEDYGRILFSDEQGLRSSPIARAAVTVESIRPGLYREGQLAAVTVSPETPMRLIPVLAVYGSVDFLDESGGEVSTEGAFWVVRATQGLPLFLLSALDGSLVEDTLSQYRDGGFFDS